MDLLDKRIALVLGGGAARALAHIGVLEVLEAHGLRPACVAGTSMGGLVGALHAAGLPASEIQRIAAGFRFPGWFIPGGLIAWERVFGPAARILRPLTFERLTCPLALVAVDIDTGRQVVLRSGRLLEAVKATCAVPAVLPPVEIEGRLLVDGALVNVLPADVAQAWGPDVIVAVNVSASRSRSRPSLRRGTLRWAASLARLAPNPFSARLSFELLVRSAEIALDRQSTLAAAMASPDLLVDVDVGPMGLREFDRLDDAVGAGRCAMRQALPALRRILETPTRPSLMARAVTLQFDPICDMVVNPTRARAAFAHLGKTFYFCSTNCRDAFAADPDRHARPPAESVAR